MSIKDKKDATHVCLDSGPEGCSQLKLSAFVDGETSWWQSIFIRKKLCSSFEARQFVDRLERSSQSFKQQFEIEAEKDSQNLAVSERVMSRIAQEERLSLLRSLPAEYPTAESFLGRIFSVDRMAWGSFGAALASLIFVFVLPSMSAVVPTQNIADQKIVAANLVGFAPVENISAEDLRELRLAAASNNRNAAYGRQFFNPEDSTGYTPYRSVSTYRDPQNPDDSAYGNSLARNDSFYLKHKQIAPQVVEVDWVRSAGRVKVLRNPNGKASILWVQKRQPDLSRFQQRNPVVNNTAPSVEFVSNK